MPLPDSPPSNYEVARASVSREHSKNLGLDSSLIDDSAHTTSMPDAPGTLTGFGDIQQTRQSQMQPSVGMQQQQPATQSMQQQMQRREPPFDLTSQMLQQQRPSFSQQSQHQPQISQAREPSRNGLPLAVQQMQQPSSATMLNNDDPSTSKAQFLFGRGITLPPHLQAAQQNAQRQAQQAEQQQRQARTQQIEEQQQHAAEQHRIQQQQRQHPQLDYLTRSFRGTSWHD